MSQNEEGMLPPKSANLICMTLAGTPHQRYDAGVPVERIVPYASIMARCPVCIARFSYRDHHGIGIASDPEAVPDHDRSGSLLADSFLEVLALAEEKRSAGLARPPPSDKMSPVPSRPARIAGQRSRACHRCSS